ncbi:unnamed protein product [Symbiodinium microadriaticum]|nr:unnamed protein product [Symbiodinium sp. KB8]CAE7249328.1 unnamed protein product [Symbiodinium microadriaticum]
MVLGAMVMAVAASLAQGCSRAVYEDAAGHFYTGRTMDWTEPTKAKIWAFPKGMKRDGGVGAGSLEWTSKWSSVVTSMYDIASVDGMNEKGLVGSMLYLVETDYGNEHRGDQKKLSVGAWMQYVLDSFATVPEAVSALQSDALNIIAPDLPSGDACAAHLALSDASNGSAIFEYIAGRLVIHNGSQYKVMTNSPPYDQQLALTAYWEGVGGNTFLPGTHRAADRFARLSFNLHAVPKANTPEVAVATAFSLVRSISVPLGLADPHHPNLASTRWRSVTDHTHGKYYFDSVINPSVFWVDLDNIDFTGGVQRLPWPEEDLAGDVSKKFVPSEPFPFIHPPARQLHV